VTNQYKQPNPIPIPDFMPDGISYEDYERARMAGQPDSTAQSDNLNTTQSRITRDSMHLDADDPVLDNYLTGLGRAHVALGSAAAEGRESGYIKSSISTYHAAIATRRNFLKSRRRQP
jgi:hypothetical protein